MPAMCPTGSDVGNELSTKIAAKKQ